MNRRSALGNPALVGHHHQYGAMKFGTRCLITSVFSPRTRSEECLTINYELKGSRLGLKAIFGKTCRMKVPGRLQSPLREYQCHRRHQHDKIWLRICMISVRRIFTRCTSSRLRTPHTSTGKDHRSQYHRQPATPRFRHGGLQQILRLWPTMCKICGNWVPFLRKYRLKMK